MYQQPLFLCMTCGGDTLLHPHTHPPQREAIQLYRCPICREYKLTTEDPNDDTVDWVALGEVVCGSACHAKAYDLMRTAQYVLPFEHDP